MQYFYNDNGKKIEVELERIMWGVVYDDDSELLQFDADGNFHRIGEVDQDRVKLFVAISTSDPLRRIDIVVPKGARIIHKYRNFVFDFGGEEKRARIHIFGIKHDGHFYYNFILPDGRIVQSVDDEPRLTEFNI